MYKYQILLLASMIGATPAMAALQAIGEQELGQISAAEGITIGVKGEFKADIAYKNDTDENSSYIVLANNGGDFLVPDIKIDLDTLDTALEPNRALKISLPSKITGRRFNLGDLVLSPGHIPKRTDTINEYGEQEIETDFVDVTPNTPNTKTFQAVLTADNYRFAAADKKGKVGFDNDRFNPDLGVNELELQIQDVGGTLDDATGVVSPTGAGNLKISKWHKFGTATDEIDENLLSAAKARRAAYAPTDAGNKHQEELYKNKLKNLTQPFVINNAIAVSSVDYFFIKGMEAAIAKDKDKVMDIKCNFYSTGCNLKQWDTNVLSRPGMSVGSPKEEMYVCNKEGGSCTSKSGDSSITGIGSGVVKYRINMTSRIDPIDSDKVIVKTTCSDNGDSTACADGQIARYENKIIENKYWGSKTEYAYSNGYDGHFKDSAGGCFKSGDNMHCEARPIVEGLSWYIKNDNYKTKEEHARQGNTKPTAYAVSAKEYQGLSEGAQLAHDPRVIFTVDKQTEVRLMAINRNCSRWCGNDFDSSYKVQTKENKPMPDKKAPRPAYRQTAMAPAVVLLDAEGNLIDYDNVSGGEALKLDKDGMQGSDGIQKYKQVENTETEAIRRKTKVWPSKEDDHGFFPMGLMEVTIGDPYYHKIKNRVLSTMSITASKEALKPTSNGLENWSQNHKNISFGLGGSAKIFAHQ